MNIFKLLNYIFINLYCQYQHILDQRNYYKYKYCSFEEFVLVFEKYNPEYFKVFECFYEYKFNGAPINKKHYCNNYNTILNETAYIFNSYKDYKKYYFWLEEKIQNSKNNIIINNNIENENLIDAYKILQSEGIKFY